MTTEWKEYMASPKTPAEQIVADALDKYAYSSGPILVHELCIVVCRAMESAIKTEVAEQLKQHSWRNRFWM